MTRQNPKSFAVTAITSGLIAFSVCSLADPYGADQALTYNGITYFSGGLGIEQREHLMKTVAHDYNLKIVLTSDEGNYVGDIRVQIVDDNGAEVMDAISEGPWFFTRLGQGDYEVRASGYGRTFSESVQVPESGLTTVLFNQWDKDRVVE